MRRGTGPSLLLAVALALGACAGSSPERPPEQAFDATTPSPPPVTEEPTTTSPATNPPATRSPAARAPSTTAPPDPTPSGRCAVGAQRPPPGTIAANFPTALAFAPDGRLFFAERAGTIRVFQDGQTRVFATVPTVTTEAGGGYSERGLLGLAVSPTFASDRYVYAFYSHSNRTRQDVIRWADCAGEATEPKIVIHLPAGPTCCHKGGRLAFGPDGKLYVTLGDQHTPAAAADPSDVRGKVLRYNPDGTVPADNPFGLGSPIWASGFRNPFGLAISSTGRVAVTSNGPTGDAGSPPTGFDIVATDVTRGSSYQWPSCYGYSHPIGGAPCAGREPEWSSESRAVVPTGATFVNASGPARYAGRLVFCTFNDGMLVVTDGRPRATVTPGEPRCRLDVKQGPDDALYFSDTSRIHRLG